MEINQMRQLVAKSHSHRTIRDLFFVEMASSYINNGFISMGFMQILKYFFRKVFSKNPPIENQILISYLFEIAIRWIYFSLDSCFPSQISPCELNGSPSIQIPAATKIKINSHPTTLHVQLSYARFSYFLSFLDT